MTIKTPDVQPDHKRYFIEKLGLSERLMERCLGEALSAGGDYADLYFESVTSTSLGIDESLVKSASQGISVGCGIRVVSGERTGYAYTDDLSSDRLLRAARTAALIASGPAKETDLRLPPHHGHAVALPHRRRHRRRRDRRQARTDPARRPGRARLRSPHHAGPRRLQRRASPHPDRRIRRHLRLRHPAAGAPERLRHRQGRQRQSRGGITARGTSGGGGRVTLDFFEGNNSPEHFAREAARTAILQLDAIAAPAGEMPVVLGPGWPGVLLHEAVGHGLEADFNRKKTSAFAGLIGQKVASEKVTVVDNGRMPNRRGSINMDDEGNPTQETVLIENGILKGYLSDKLSSRLMGTPNTGTGRRESYHHIPMPRMTNTYMLNGDDMPEDIIKCVQRGLYAVNFGGGQVDITNGKFVFSASEAYLIEDGKVTRPVKGATLIGNGPEALKYVSMVGNDLALDEGIGTCGKAGQSVPVGVGMPTVKLDRMTVGGTGQ